MNALIARFLPNLLPGLGAFANPWVLLVLLVMLVGSFLFGVHMEAGRLEAFEAQVKVVGDAQNRRAAQRVKTNKRLLKEANDAYKVKYAGLSSTISNLQRRLLADPGSGFVPPGQQPVGSQCPHGQVCYDAAEFDRALRGFATEVAGIVGEGETLKLKLDTAVTWMIEQRQYVPD